MDKMTNLRQVRNRIDKNYYFIKSLEKIIPLQKDDLDKLKLISYIGRLYSEFVTGVYSSYALEKEIIEIGKSIEFIPKRKAVKRHILHVMTKAGVVGGHSVVVNNWIQWDDNVQYSIAFTEMQYEEIPIFLKKSVEQSGGKIICLEEENYLCKAKELLEVSQDYERVILHMHMYDVVPVLAYSNQNWRIPVYFFNHADFRFSYGFSVSDIILNMFKYDMKKSIYYRGTVCSDNVVLENPGRGRVLKKGKEYSQFEKKEIRRALEIPENIKLIVSMGTDFKYEDIVGANFSEFVLELLNKCDKNTYFLIIGADKEREKWRKLENKTGGRVKALGLLQRDKAQKLISVADLYIVAFPMNASGAMYAEEYGVPYLSLTLINRERKIYEESGAKTIDELIYKSLDAINGNKEKYSKHLEKNVLTKEKWLKRWRKICKIKAEHRNHMFRAHRYVRRQEYINCQLMQNLAIENIKRDLDDLMLNADVRAVIDILGRLWNMEFTCRDEAGK